MLAIPANIAQCKSIILCSPPNQQGKIHPAILYTAQLCGVHQFIKLVEAQAIAAMSLVQKLFQMSIKFLVLEMLLL
ncbi:MAG: histidinol dehydrogenase [Chitinophagales bacterium]